MITDLLHHLVISQQIPESAKRRLLEFHKRAGLVFASYDLLERGDDDIVFLECNPCRVAWLWLEKCLGLTVTEHVAHYLLGEHNSHEESPIDAGQGAVVMADDGKGSDNATN